MKPDHGEIVLYQSEDDQAAVDVYMADDTVWLNQAQMAELFQRDQSVISRHVNNVYKEGELPRQSNMQKMHIANSDKPVAFYNLDVIISVGYRVKSKNGIRFHILATKILKDKLDLEAIRGVEGDAAHVYFDVFDHLVIRNKQDFFFHQRNRRPPLDRMNCLLSFLYTLVMHDVRSALECTGLDPAVGFLHRDRPGRPGLALDLMKEFRPMADRLALCLVNLGQLQKKDFIISEEGGVRMKDQILLSWL